MLNSHIEVQTTNGQVIHESQNPTKGLFNY